MTNNNAPLQNTRSLRKLKAHRRLLLTVSQRDYIALLASAKKGAKASVRVRCINDIVSTLRDGIPGIDHHVKIQRAALVAGAIRSCDGEATANIVSVRNLTPIRAKVSKLISDCSAITFSVSARCEA